MHKSQQLKTYFERSIYQLTAFVFLLTSVFFAINASASAAQITARKLTLGSSAASAATTYTFNFTVPSSTVLQSMQAQICTAASGTCTTPAGFSNASSTLASQPTNLGDATGWTVNTSTAGSLRISKSGNTAAPTGAQTVVFGNVTNPSATNSTFYARITTYSDSAWSSAVDTGTVAASTAGQITVTASIDETLTFTLSTATVALGTLSTGSTASGTSTMSASTNGGSGYAITVNGTTLTSGANTIAALSSPTASSTNTSQFGINLVSNSTPSVGANVSGSGSGTAASGYSTTNQFKFVSGDTVASAAAATNSNTYTVSYIANIGGAQAAGSYTTTLTYIATATF